MAGAHGLGSVPRGVLPYLGVASLLMWGLPEEWRWRLEGWGAWRTAAAGLLAGLAIVLVNETQRFIYFKF